MLEMQLRCHASIESIEFLDSMCIEFLKKAEFEDYRRLNFAIHETVINSVNAVIDKFGEDNLEYVTVTINVYTERIEIFIKDNAGGISEEEWNKINDKDFSDVLMNDRGRGFLFIKHLVDNFDYYVNSRGESVFKLVKGCDIIGKI